MKKVLIYTLVLAVLLCLTSCSQMGGPEHSQSDSPSSDQSDLGDGSSQPTDGGADGNADKGDADSTSDGSLGSSSTGSTNDGGSITTTGNDGAGVVGNSTDAPDDSVATKTTTTTAGKTSKTSTKATVNTGNNGGDGGKVTKPTTTTTKKITTTTTTKRTTIKTQAGHTHTIKRTVKQPPTCTEQGYTQIEYPCCGAVEPKTDLVPALGHAFGDWYVAKEPTHSANGESRRHCYQCPYEESKPIAKLPMTTDADKKAILDLVNAERKKAGVKTLSYYMAEEAAANQRVADIKDTFSHYRANGDPFYKLMKGLGTDFYGCGENIASGFNTPASVMTAWMNSPNHKANILDPDFDALVVGVKDGYWVQLFIDFG